MNKTDEDAQHSDLINALFERDGAAKFAHHARRSRTVDRLSSSFAPLAATITSFFFVGKMRTRNASSFVAIGNDCNAVSSFPLTTIEIFDCLAMNASK